MADVPQNRVKCCASPVKHESGLPQNLNKVLTLAMAMGSAILFILTNVPVDAPPERPTSANAQAMATILQAERIVFNEALPPQVSKIENEIRRLIEFE